MPLVAYHTLAHAGKHLDVPIIVDLHPENLLCEIISDAADDVARVEWFVPDAGLVRIATWISTRSDRLLRGQWVRAGWCGAG